MKKPKVAKDARLIIMFPVGLIDIFTIKRL